MEKTIRENFPDGLSSLPEYLEPASFTSGRSSHTFPVVRFIIPQVKIPFPSQSKEDGRERGRIISPCFCFFGEQRDYKGTL